MAIDYIVYGGDHSLFTGKVRAYMRYKGLNREERTATRQIYRDIIPDHCLERRGGQLELAEGRAPEGLDAQEQQP